MLQLEKQGKAKIKGCVTRKKTYPCTKQYGNLAKYVVAVDIHEWYKNSVATRLYRKQRWVLPTSIKVMPQNRRWSMPGPVNTKCTGTPRKRGLQEPNGDSPRRSIAPCVRVVMASLCLAHGGGHHICQSRALNDARTQILHMHMKSPGFKDLTGHLWLDVRAVPHQKSSQCR